MNGIVGQCDYQFQFRIRTGREQHHRCIAHHSAVVGTGKVKANSFCLIDRFRSIEVQLFSDASYMHLHVLHMFVEHGIVFLSEVDNQPCTYTDKIRLKVFHSHLSFLYGMHKIINRLVGTVAVRAKTEVHL